MKTRAAFFTIFTVFLILISTVSAQGQQTREVMLAGYKMEPRVGTGASGLVTIHLHKDTLSVKGGFTDLMSKFYGAYIMGEIRGQAGNVIFKLKADLNENKTGGRFKPGENSFALSAAHKKLLNKGKLFITVASWDHQRGEIRAKIPPMK